MKDQLLFSIIGFNGKVLGHIETVDGKFVTTGEGLPNSTFNDIVELIKGLYGYNISIDNFYA